MDGERPDRPSPGTYRAPARVAVVLSGWPRVSETFALNELIALQRRGMLAAVFATKPGDASLCQPDVSAIDDLVTVLPEVGAVAQGQIVAEQLRGRGVVGVHGYFAHRPAAVARIAAAGLGVPFGFSAHALDVRKVDLRTLRERAAAARLVVSCNADAAAALDRRGAEVLLLPHGVDLERFSCRRRSPLDTGLVEVLAVGRLVAKKGFADLVEAMSEVDGRIRLTIIGEGPERANLERLICGRALGGRVRLVGRRTHEELPARYAQADIVVVPSIVDRNGDRDGLPNVVLEAMAAGCAVVATDVAAIATAVHDGVTGLLVAPRRPAALGAALTTLVASPARRRRLGAAGRAFVRREFALSDCTDRFCDALELHYG